MDDLVTRLNDSGLSTVKLDHMEVETLLNTLVYDGKAECRVTSAKSQYRVVRYPEISGGITAIPCGVCPVW